MRPPLSVAMNTKYVKCFPESTVHAQHDRVQDDTKTTMSTTNPANIHPTILPAAAKYKADGHCFASL